MIETKPDDPKVGAKYPIAVGTIYFSNAPDYNGSFLRAAALHDFDKLSLYDDDDKAEVTKEVLQNECSYIGAITNESQLDMLCRHKPVDVKYNDCALIRINARFETEYEGVKFRDGWLDICDAIVPLPEWYAWDINFHTCHPGKLYGISYQLSFFVYGERVYGSNFAETIKAWWTRTMVAFNVTRAVCHIDDCGNSCILTEDDKDTEFLSVLNEEEYE